MLLRAFGNLRQDFALEAVARVLAQMLHKKEFYHRTDASAHTPAFKQTNGKSKNAHVHTYMRKPFHCASWPCAQEAKYIFDVARQVTNLYRSWVPSPARSSKSQAACRLTWLWGLLDMDKWRLRGTEICTATGLEAAAVSSGLNKNAFLTCAARTASRVNVGNWGYTAVARPLRAR